jgi:methionyl-tRNA formyltransferase
MSFRQLANIRIVVPTLAIAGNNSVLRGHRPVKVPLTLTYGDGGAHLKPWKAGAQTPEECMFDTIILLTGPLERAALPAALLGHNPSLTVLTIERADELAAIESDVLARSRLIAFVTAVIVPKTILDRIGYGAVNFHPGPPNYPGWAPAHFALYDQTDEFGATVHLMVEKVDAGPIIDLALFPVPPDTSVFALEGMAYARLAFLFWRMARELACDLSLPKALSVEWGRRKYSRRNYLSLCEIPLDISKDELDRRMRVFGGNYFGVTPSIKLHGIEFRAVASPDVASPDVAGLDVAAQDLALAAS